MELLLGPPSSGLSHLPLSCHKIGAVIGVALLWAVSTVNEPSKTHEKQGRVQRVTHLDVDSSSRHARK